MSGEVTYVPVYGSRLLEPSARIVPFGVGALLRPCQSEIDRHLTSVEGRETEGGDREGEDGGHFQGLIRRAVLLYVFFTLDAYSRLRCVFRMNFYRGANSPSPTGIQG